MHILIDGYNLIRQSDTLRRFEKTSLEEGRKALIRFLMPYRQSTGHRMTVVFDGWKAGSPMEERDREGGVDIIYSHRGQLADEVIKRIADKSGEEIIVVTSDRDIASFVEHRGGTAVPSGEFEAILQTKADKTPLPHAGADEDLAIGGKDEDEDIQAGKPHKGPSKRLSRRERDYRKRVQKL